MSTLTFKVDEEFNQTRLDVYLAQKIEDVPSRNYVQKIIESKKVTVNEDLIESKNYKVTTGDEVVVELEESFDEPQEIKPEKIPLDIFYENEHWLIVNKPSGMMVHPATGIYTGTLVNALLYHCKNLSDYNTAMRAGIVHRLDKETSGLMVVAKDNKTHAKIAQQFQKHEVRKRYVALVRGKVEFDQGMIDASLGRHPIHRQKKTVRFDESAKEAITYYEVLKRHDDTTLIALFPQTGRTHQLRVHMAHLNHPILGDDKYGRKDTFPRLALHAQSIGFTDPTSKRYVEFSSVIPRTFLAKVHFRSPADIDKLINN